MTGPEDPVPPPTSEPAPTPPPTSAAEPASEPAPTPPPPRSAAGDAPTRLGARTVLVGFALVLGAFLLLAAVGAILADAPDPPPDCPPGTECGGPPGVDANPSSVVAATGAPSRIPAAVPPGTVGIRAGAPWKSADQGWEFEYSDWWALDESDGSRADLVFQGNADALLVVASVPSTEASPEAYADRWFSLVQDQAPDLRVDTSEKNAVLGPAIGFIDGIGRTYAGTWASPQSGISPIGVTLVTASDGRTTVAVVLIVWNPDKTVGSTWLQHGVRSTAELVLKTFRWGPS